MSDAFNLLEEARKLPDNYLENFSEADLDAILSNDVNTLSEEGVRIFERGKQDLGAGEFLDTGASILGSIGGGALAGSAFGPVGTVVGSVAGGALGAFGGELVEDLVAKRNIDLYGALKEGGVSALIDSAMFGAGKLVRPMLRARKGVPMPTLTELKSKITDAMPGTDVSLQSTQRLLQEGDPSATLARGQVRELGLGGRIGESVARAGIGSADIMNKNFLLSANILQDNLKKQIGTGVAQSSEDVGIFVFKAVEEGRQAAQDIFGSKLAEAADLLGTGNVPTTAIRSTIKSFLKSHRKQWLNTLDKQARSTARSFDDMLKLSKGDVNKVVTQLVEQGVDEELAPALAATLTAGWGRQANGETLMALYKHVNSVINDYMPGSAKANANTVADLTKLSKAVRGSIKGVLNDISPAARQVFEEANEGYAKAMKGLAPEAVPAFVQKGTNESWHSLGKTLVKATDPSQVKQLYKSIDESYRLVGEAGRRIPANAPQSAAEAKQIIKASYLQDVFHNFLEEAGSNLAGAGTKASNLIGDPAVTKAITGDSYMDTKRLLNAMVDTTTQSRNALESGMLAVRSQEIQGVQAIPQIALTAGALGAGGVVGGLLGAAAIFTIPAILAKIATNPKAVNALLADNAKILAMQAAGKEIPAEMIASAISKVFSNFTDLETAMLEAELRTYSVER